MFVDLNLKKGTPADCISKSDQELANQSNRTRFGVRFNQRNDFARQPMESVCFRWCRPRGHWRTESSAELTCCICGRNFQKVHQLGHDRIADQCRKPRDSSNWLPFCQSPEGG